MLLETTHTTRYLYKAPVSQCLSEVHLTPRDFPGQRLVNSRIQVQPEPAGIEKRRDYFGNVVHSFAIFRSHERFTTTATSVVEVEALETPSESKSADAKPTDAKPAGNKPTGTQDAEAKIAVPKTTGPKVTWPKITWEDARDQVSAQADETALAAFEFVFESPYVTLSPEFAAYAKPSFEPGRPLVDAVLDLSHRIHSDFTYLPKSTSIDMPLKEVFHNRCGVCQDFSHVMIGALRSLRLPARYVSGYLRSGKNYQGAEASHAWVAAFVPGAGWLSVDPTNDVRPSDGHVTVGWGRDYSDVTPVKGIALGGGQQTVEVEVYVRPVDTEVVLPR